MSGKLFLSGFAHCSHTRADTAASSGNLLVRVACDAFFKIYEAWRSENRVSV